MGQGTHSTQEAPLNNLFKKWQLAIGFAYLNQIHFCALNMALSENLCCFVETLFEKSILFLWCSYKGFFIMALIFIIMKINICMKTGFLFFENYS